MNCECFVDDDELTAFKKSFEYVLYISVIRSIQCKPLHQYNTMSFVRVCGCVCVCVCVCKHSNSKYTVYLTKSN